MDSAGWSVCQLAGAGVGNGYTRVPITPFGSAFVEADHGISKPGLPPELTSEVKEGFEVLGVQARITLPAEIRREIDLLRTRWNPERADGNPAHVTVVYQDEAPDPLLLAERLRAEAPDIAPFWLTLGSAARFPEPVRGVYLEVADPTDGVVAIREALLASPFTRRAQFGLHVTLLHPDQGARLESAWAELSALPEVCSFQVTELQLVGPRHETLFTVRLSHTRREHKGDASISLGGFRPGEPGR